MKFEICVDSVEAALAAQAAGAQRVELCANLVEGGTTPSLGMMEETRQAVTLGIQAMIRPRGGDFVYTPAEFAVMRRDLTIAKAAGMDGAVFGLLLPDGTVDVARTQMLVELARPLTVTFHRAFDLCRDPFEALETLIDLGVDRILTGGGTFRAADGLQTLGRLVQQAGDRLTILVGGGVNASNIAQIMAATGATEAHFAARRDLDSPMRYRVPGLFMGAPYTPDEYTRKVTDKALIAAVIEAARGG
jgi:copper homeostasis protein